MKSFKPSPPKTMTVMQIAKDLQISRSTAYELVRSQKFPKFKVGKRILVSRDAFQSWIREQTMLACGEDT